MATTKFGRSGFTIPLPKPGDGTKIFMNHDGSMTCSWDNRMAMDAALMPPAVQGDNGGDDLADKIHQLLDGKLKPADIEALIQLIQGGGGEQDGPAQQPPDIAQDRMIRRAVAPGAQARAKQGAEQHAALIGRFPNLKNARVV
jgi:hypothetical protein